MTDNNLLEDSETLEDSKLLAPLLTTRTSVKSEEPSQLYQEKTQTEAVGKSNFQTILRNAGTDAVNRISVSSTNFFNYDDLTEEERKALPKWKIIKQKTTGDGVINLDKVSLVIEGYYSDKIKTNTLASKLFNFANMAALASNTVGQDFTNGNSVNLNLYDIAKLVGRNIEDRVRKSQFKKEVIDALEILKRIEIKIIVEVIRGKHIHDRIRSTRLVTAYEYSKKGDMKDTITLAFDEVFMQYLSVGYLSTFRKSIMQLDDASYHFHTELMQYFSMPNNHLSRSKEQTTPVQARIISLETAIKWIGTWRTLDQIKQVDRKYSEHIVEPLERILDDENGAILKWEWCKAKGERLTEEEKANIAKYDLLKDLYIHFIELKDEADFINDIYAGTGHTIERREKKAQQKTRRTNKAKAQQPKPPKDD